MRDIKTEVYNKHFAGLGFGETRDTVNVVLKNIENYIKSVGLSVCDDDGKIKDYYNNGCEFVKKLRALLNPLGRGVDYEKSSATGFSDEVLKAKMRIVDIQDDDIKGDDGWISYWKILSGDIRYGKLNLILDDLRKGMRDSKYYYPIPNLEGICYEYLTTKYYQCEEVDRIIVGSLIQRTFQDYVIGAFRSFYLPKINDGMISMQSWDENFEKRYNRLLLWGSMRVSVYNMMSVALGVSASLTTYWWVGPLVWLAMWNLLRARVYFKYGDRDRQNDRISEKIRDAYRVVRLIDANFVTPLYLKQQLHEVEGEGLYFSPSTYLILDNAIERCGINWGVREAYDYLG